MQICTVYEDIALCSRDLCLNNEDVFKQCVHQKFRDFFAKELLQGANTQRIPMHKLLNWEELVVFSLLLPGINHHVNLYHTYFYILEYIIFSFSFS